MGFHPSMQIKKGATDVDLLALGSLHTSKGGPGQSLHLEIAISQCCTAVVIKYPPACAPQTGWAGGWHVSTMLARRFSSADGSTVVDPPPRLSPLDMGEAIQALRNSTMFSTLSEANLRRVAGRMHRLEFNKGDVLMRQGEAQEHMYVVTSGTVKRERYERGRVHDTETLGASHSLNTIGALHLLRCEPTYATARCESPIVAYRLSSTDLDELLCSPSIAKEVVFALTREIKRQSIKLRTPLLEQHSLQLPIVPTSVAAAIESFYRSALNSWLNYRLTGHSAALFPNMHVQLPTRVLYINGFKIIRQTLDEHVQPDDYSHPDAVRWLKVGGARAREGARVGVDGAVARGPGWVGRAPPSVCPLECPRARA